jgi:N-methylhydantoinase A/oxoprolinase/acetone carboxylase beta subunit
MAYVIGIDTGGTYTDAVLLNTDKQGADGVERKSKAFTTHDKLELGIRNSIENLNITRFENEQTEKVVISTTLATNAIVEGNIHKVGLVLIGDRVHGNIATEYVKIVSGSINIKGHVLENIDREETKKAIEELLPNVESIAVSGLASVRNPVLEQEVKKIIQSISQVPVMCGHELVSDLGFLERTNTVVLNAGLLPTINSFIGAIKKVLLQLNIKAPVFVVRGDGSIVKLDAIQHKPIDTVLSGPAASMIGAINLAEIKDAIVADMGGTTTDIGVVRNKRVELSPDGATIGGWKIKIKSAKLYTFGLGGDSHISSRNGTIEIGPKSVLPACRDGGDVVTPTDILHYTGRFVKWNKDKAVSAIKRHAERAGMNSDEYVMHAIKAISKKIAHENKIYNKSLDLPIYAIGAPAESWYHIAKEKHSFKLVIPKHFEVANAVGAATAGIENVVEAIVRPGEGGYGYLVHTTTGRYAFTKKEEAVNKAIEVSKDYAVKMIEEQNLEVATISVSGEDLYNNGGQLIQYQISVSDNGQVNYEKENVPATYLETHIKVTVSGKIFTDEAQVKNFRSMPAN